MASIDDRRVHYYDPITGKHCSKRFSTVAAAKQFALDKEREATMVRDGWLDERDVQSADRRRTPLGPLVDEFNDDREHRSVSKPEIAGTTAMIQLILDRCRFRLVKDLDAAEIKRCLRDLSQQREWSARTFNRYREALAGLCGWLKRHRYLDENPMALVDVLDQQADPKRPSRALTVQEADAIVNAALDPLRRLLYLLRFRTGLRGRECKRLVWADLDLSAGVVNLRASTTKNHKADSLPLAADLLTEIADYQSWLLRDGRAPGADDLVFPTIPDRRTWRRDLDRALVDYRTRDGQADPKCLRKTFDSFLTRADVDLTVVSLLMRHTPRGGMNLTLGVYGDHDALLARKRAAVDRMVRWIEKQQKPAKGGAILAL